MQNINRIVISAAAIIMSMVLFLQGNKIMLDGSLLSFIAGGCLKVIAIVGTISLLVTCYKQLNLRTLVLEIIGLCVIAVVASIAMFLVYLGQATTGILSAIPLFIGASVLAALLYAYVHELWITVKGLW